MKCTEPQAHPSRCGCEPEAPVGYVSGERFQAEHERLRECRKERDQLRAELSALKAQQVGQEPVAWRMWNGKTWRFCYSDLHGKRGWEALYTAPQPAPAQDVAGLVGLLREMRKHEDEPSGYKYPVSLWFPKIDATLAASTGQEVEK